MASFKVRRREVAKGGIQIGASGSPVSGMLFGTVSACVPAMSGSGLNSGSMNIPGVPAGAKLFFNGACPAGVHIVGASVTATGSVTASYIGASGATIASTLTFYYLAVW